MSFYRRYNGFGATAPSVRSVYVDPVKVPPASPVIEKAVSVIPPPAAVYTKSLETFPIGPQLEPIKFLSPRPVEATLQAPTKGAPPPQPIPVGRRSYVPEGRQDFTTKEVPISQDFVAKEKPIFVPVAAPLKVPEGRQDFTTQLAPPLQKKPLLFTDKQADEAGRDAIAAGKLLDKQAAEAQREAEKSQKLVDKQVAEAERAARKMDEDRVAKAAAEALAESVRARKYNESLPPSPGGPGGGGGPPPADEQPMVEVPLTNGTTAVVTVAPSSPIVPVAAAGAAGAVGFLVGGPLGALLGAAAGYFLAPKKKAQVSGYFRGYR